MKRRRPAVTTIEYDVPLGQPVSCRTAAYVAQDLVKHLLFMRNQAPALVDDLAAKVQGQDSEGPQLAEEEPESRARPAVNRKLHKFISRVGGVTAALTPAALAQHSTRVLLLLGPSPLRPLEAYSLSWPSLQADESATADEGTEQAAKDASRRALRSLIVNTASGPEGKASAGPTKLFVMLQAPELQDALPNFLPKRTFQLKQRRGLQVHMRLRNPGACEEDETDKLPDDHDSSRPGGEPGAVSDTGLLWYQCTTHVKGICTSTQAAGQGHDFM